MRLTHPTNRTMLLKLLGVPITLLLFAIPAQSQSTLKQSGTVLGQVMAPDNGLITGATVIVFNQSLRQEAVTDQEGRYKVELPPGTYEITTKARYFCPVKRSEFVVKTGRTYLINLHPSVAGSESSCLWPSDTFAFRDKAGVRRTLVISYSERQEIKGKVRYRGIQASYDTITIEGAVAEFDVKEFMLKAEKYVMIETGRDRLHGLEVRLYPKLREFTLRMVTTD